MEHFSVSRFIISLFISPIPSILPQSRPLLSIGRRPTAEGELLFVCVLFLFCFLSSLFSCRGQTLSPFLPFPLRVPLLSPTEPLQNEKRPSLTTQQQSRRSKVIDDYIRQRWAKSWLGVICSQSRETELVIEELQVILRAMDEIDPKVKLDDPATASSKQYLLNFPSTDSDPEFTQVSTVTPTLCIYHSLTHTYGVRVEGDNNRKKGHLSDKYIYFDGRLKITLIINKRGNWGWFL